MPLVLSGRVDEGHDQERETDQQVKDSDHTRRSPLRGATHSTTTAQRGLPSAQSSDSAVDEAEDDEDINGRENDCRDDGNIVLLH